ncbi:hypothetical protein AUEXF2481DRAFT_44307 [Aureobasidium subglaciale EXF-2481]|uniref:Uncharacterized protein n=1 Tax=Aureobasidium subglaciale (strain EXF-2481) TaxID=1043005 RepID=A0A074Y0Q9_AURSE|nr:uncharacterized protein AUEXF2481DRAFT_44307 [Aureobasidium subglaciale EXF-2481]KEQ91315.1 hypothetical protein AUEXF2481DRAFT_44307 [Aureobasidium subglaciale EXF-2481]
MSLLAKRNMRISMASWTHQSASSYKSYRWQPRLSSQHAQLFCVHTCIYVVLCTVIPPCCTQIPEDVGVGKLNTIYVYPTRPVKS